MPNFSELLSLATVPDFEIFGRLEKAPQLVAELGGTIREKAYLSWIALGGDTRALAAAKERGRISPANAAQLLLEVLSPRNVKVTIESDGERRESPAIVSPASVRWFLDNFRYTPLEAKAIACGMTANPAPGLLAHLAAKLPLDHQGHRCLLEKFSVAGRQSFRSREDEKATAWFLRNYAGKYGREDIDKLADAAALHRLAEREGGGRRSLSPVRSAPKRRSLSAPRAAAPPPERLALPPPPRPLSATRSGRTVVDSPKKRPSRRQQNARTARPGPSASY